MDAFVGELWLLMVIYASVAVVAAQLLWLNSAPVLPVQTVAATHLLNPAFSILFAYWLVDEIPSGLEWAVMGVVALGMLVTRLPAARYGREPSQPSVLGLGLAGTH